MTSPRNMADKDEGFVLGKFFDNIAELVDRHATVAGHNRSKVVTYERKDVVSLARQFNARTGGGKHAQQELERARAARHVYSFDAKGQSGLDDWHLKLLADTGIADSIRNLFGPDVMLEKMLKLFDTGKKHGIGISVHQLEPGLVAIDITPPPQPKLVLVPKPPKQVFRRGF